MTLPRIGMTVLRDSTPGDPQTIPTRTHPHARTLLCSLLMLSKGRTSLARDNTPGDPCACFALCTVHVASPSLIAHAPALYVALACACHAPTSAPLVIAHAPALYVMPAVFGGCCHCICRNTLTIPHAPSLSFFFPTSTVSPLTRLTRALTRSGGTPLRACHVCIRVRV